jgi:prepilin-type N-terminal cleavage/methylation domain-containing protein
MNRAKYKSWGHGDEGFTLVELLVALTVTAIVLSAVVTLAYAMSAANDSTDDTSEKQAHLRYTTLRITELVRHSKLICSTPGDDFAIWRADGNGDGQINLNELVYVQTGPGRDFLRLCEFAPSETAVASLSDIETLVPQGQDYDISYTPLIPQCSNVEFLLDVLPPRTKLVTVSFDVVENNAVRHYQTSASLRGWASHLLSASGQIVGSDDD